MPAGHVTIVGLGPGDEAYLTDHTRSLIAAAPHRIVRTTVHPCAHVMGDAVSCDDLYESLDTFDEVYAAIVERIVTAATTHGEVLYAVPGSPLVLERTVALLRADDRVRCDIAPAMSFLDLAYARLGIDPIEARLTLVDGLRFAEAAGGLDGPLLVAHTYANWVLSDIKLAIDDPTDTADPDTDLPVVVLSHLGTAEEQVIHTTWSQLDRTVEADHLTSVYIPSLGRTAAAEFARFHELARMLRERCSWDREQTHASLVPYLLEETYEVVDALEALDPDDEHTDADLIEELGDLLYQIEFHAIVGEDSGRFTIVDVIRGIHDKLVRRHPHLFGGEAADWDDIKRAEKGRTSIFDGVAASQPSLMYAAQVLRKAARATGAAGELPEFSAERYAALPSFADDDELGELLLVIVDAARRAELDAETALRTAAQRFRARFAAHDPGR